MIPAAACWPYSTSWTYGSGGATSGGCAFINATVELASPRHPAAEAVMAHKTRCRRYFRALAEAAGPEDPDLISDQWMLLTEAQPLPRSSKET